MIQEIHRFCKSCGQELQPNCGIGNFITAWHCTNSKCHLHGIHQEGVNTPLDTIQDPDVPKTTMSSEQEET